MLLTVSQWETNSTEPEEEERTPERLETLRAWGEDEDQDEDESLYCFSCSDLVGGYCPHPGHREIFDRRELELQIVYEHKILFAILYDQPLDIDSPHSPSELYSLIQVTALAEYYLLLPSIACRLSSHFEAAPGLWRHIEQEPELYLRISNKLRAQGMFEEALRHYVGSLACNPPYHPFVYYEYPDLQNIDASVVPLVFRKQLQLQFRMQALLDELRQLGLSWNRFDPSDSWDSWKSSPRRVDATWLASGSEEDTLAERFWWIAASVYREWLDDKLHSHPSSRGSDGDKTKGQVPHSVFQYCATSTDHAIRSLRAACQEIVDADRSFEEVQTFGEHVAQQYASIFNIPGSRNGEASTIITKELRTLVRNAAHAIEQRFPCPSDDSIHWPGLKRAKHNEGCMHFTHLQINASEMPWASADEWRDFNCEIELVDASNGLLRAVGIV